MWHWLIVGSCSDLTRHLNSAPDTGCAAAAARVSYRRSHLKLVPTTSVPGKSVSQSMEETASLLDSLSRAREPAVESPAEEAPDMEPADNEDDDEDEDEEDEEDCVMSKISVQ